MTEDLAAHRPALYALARRMLGSRQDAQEVVQDTLLRALERPPRDTTAPWRPWLMTVCANLARDRLRRRRRATARRPWLPDVDLAPDPADRVERGRMASYAWLVALEALTPTQRAVVVLREVYEHDAVTVGDMLGLSPDAVRAAHARARRALRRPPEPDVGAQQAAMAALLGALVAGDADALAAILLPDVRYRADGGGWYLAAGIPLHGAQRVARALVALTRTSTGDAEVDVITAGDELILLLTRPNPRGREAPVAATVLVLAADGRVAEVCTVAHPDKVHR